MWLPVTELVIRPDFESETLNDNFYDPKAAKTYLQVRLRRHSLI